MTGREWKPGDVAVAAFPVWGGSDIETTYAETRIVRFASGWARLDDPDDFVGDDSTYRVADARPLVVIDPEDREQVERLLAQFVIAVERSYTPSHPGGWSVEALTDALREFAQPTPPRPDEPTGLGAAIRWDGSVWLGLGHHRWLEVPEDRRVEPRRRFWTEFPAEVEVLSEGVTP